MPDYMTTRVHFQHHMHDSTFMIDAQRVVMALLFITYHDLKSLENIHLLTIFTDK